MALSVLRPAASEEMAVANHPACLSPFEAIESTTPVNAVRTNFVLRLVTVIVAFFAWLVISNHCALAEMLAVKTAPVSKEERGCCHHHSAPAKDEKPRAPMQQECCKSLTVLVPDGAKLPMASLLEVIALPVEWVLVLTHALPEENRPAPDTGPPPDVPGFAELVLHRSLRSHAPPFAA